MGCAISTADTFRRTGSEERRRCLTSPRRSGR
jgi:hypothetical protein